MNKNRDHALRQMLKHILWRDKKFFSLIATYGVIVAILNLALPLSVQVLITSIIYTAILSPVIVLGIVLLALLSFSAVLTILQKSLIEIYKRNSFVRLASDIILKAIDSDYTSFRAHNTSDLSSRYFEIFNVQNYAADLIVEGFLVFLTIVVSFVLSSFYHPYFLVLNLIISLIIWLSWRIFRYRATSYAIERSEAKFAVFAWIDDIFRMSKFFRAETNRNHALSKGHTLISEYIDQRKFYWRITCSQLVILTILYVLVTIVLITVGSLLVIEGQLSLGQLVAAEILYTTSMYGVGKLSIYYDKYYNLLASVDEMSHLFWHVDNQAAASKYMKPLLAQHSNREEIITFNQVRYQDGLGSEYCFNFSIKRNTTNLILTTHHAIKNVVPSLLTRLVNPTSGYIEFNDHQVADLEPTYVSDQVILIDNSNMFGCRIGEFLSFGLSDSARLQINEVLEVVGLQDLINSLPKRLETELIGDGYPLMEEHIILLKVTRAILCRPQVIIISGVFDKIDKAIQERILGHLSKYTTTTLLCFSENEDNHNHFSNFLVLSSNKSFSANNIMQARNYMASLSQGRS